MRNTRKKVIKTVYKDEDDSEADKAAGDFSDSGSDAKISDHSDSEDDEAVSDVSSGEDFDEKSKKKSTKRKEVVRKSKFAKEFVSKINKQIGTDESVDVSPALFSVKDLTDADKLLPSFLNLSESDSSDDESPKPAKKQNVLSVSSGFNKDSDSETETNPEYNDVWSKNILESEEVAKKTFMELEQHKSQMEEAKASIQSYALKQNNERVSDVNDLLAQGEEVLPQEIPVKKGRKGKKVRDDSDSELEDWEEVNDAKPIPQQGLQLVVGIPGDVCRKSKKLDIEMMMKRKLNRVKKEYQVYMHKVHVLCWLGHGNFVSRVLNDQEILAAALSLVPSKECYPGERVDMKYVEQIATWYKDKISLKQDKNEGKFRPKAPPLKQIMLEQIKSRRVTAKKYLVFIFVSMLRAVGLQCRVMFNFVTLPIKPPASELCSLSTKPKEENKSASDKEKQDEKSKAKGKKKGPSKCKAKGKLSQVDGTYDDSYSSASDTDFENIMQVDGNNDALTVKSTRSSSRTNKNNLKAKEEVNEDVSPPKRARKTLNSQSTKEVSNTSQSSTEVLPKRKRVIKKSQDEIESKIQNEHTELTKPSLSRRKAADNISTNKDSMQVEISTTPLAVSTRRAKNIAKTNAELKLENDLKSNPTDTGIPTDKSKLNRPKIIITNEEGSGEHFAVDKSTGGTKKLSLTRRRSKTANPSTSEDTDSNKLNIEIKRSRTRSAPGNKHVESKFFSSSCDKEKPTVTKKTIKSGRITKKDANLEDTQRVSHRDIVRKSKPKVDNDVTTDLVAIIKTRVKEAKDKSKIGIVKDKVKIESDEDSDHLPVETRKRRYSESDEDFKPVKISPKPSTSRKIDRRVLSSDDDVANIHRMDVWCEVFVEELEQWIAVDVIRGKAHCTNEIYSRATHPVCYVVGWDNNNYLKDLTRRYVPHWNTVTRKQRAEPAWWDEAVRPWLAPRSARDREEDEQLNRIHLEAPLPKTVGEYKNHPLYALKRHLLKFEALYPPDAATLGFVRGEAVYARECVYVCQSRDKWLKDAKVVRLGEQPYKIVKARPKWDKLSNKLITDKPLEVFGPWQVQDYEPPTAENGIVPRNAYGNVELFKECMLPKGTVHVKLPGLNRVAKKLNIDCAPAMTGFDFNGGWSHPVYDGFVVCKEYEEIITEAWVKDQEEQERKEQEKIEARVYGNWKRLIKGLYIRERLKDKYGFEDPSTSQEKSKSKGPRLVVKKRS